MVTGAWCEIDLPFASMPRKLTKYIPAGSFPAGKRVESSFDNATGVLFTTAPLVLIRLTLPSVREVLLSLIVTT